LGIFWYIKNLTETLDCRALDFVAQREIRQNFSAQVGRSLMSAVAPLSNLQIYELLHQDKLFGFGSNSKRS
jgi:hypothetical protein